MNIFDTYRSNDELEKIVKEFRDLLKINENIQIKILWGRKAKRVLGSVRLIKNVSVIRISKYLEDYIVPEYVIKEVILHEMIHIKTGYGSVLSKEYKNAHRGGVIRKEMEAVGKSDIYDDSNLWIKNNWYKHVRNFDFKERKYLRNNLIKK